MFWFLSLISVTTNAFLTRCLFIKTGVNKYHESYVGSSEIANNLLATFACAFSVGS